MPFAEFDSLYLYQVAQKPGINTRTGRFVKGITPHNKGKKWDEWMSKEAQAHSLEQLRIGREMYMQRRKVEKIRKPTTWVPIVAVSLKDGSVVVYKGMVFACERLQTLYGSKFGTIQAHIKQCISEKAYMSVKRIDGKVYRYPTITHSYYGYKWFYERDVEKWQKAQQEILDKIKKI